MPLVLQCKARRNKVYTGSAPIPAIGTHPLLHFSARSQPDTSTICICCLYLLAMYSFWTCWDPTSAPAHCSGTASAQSLQRPPCCLSRTLCYWSVIPPSNLPLIVFFNLSRHPAPQILCMVTSNLLPPDPLLHPWVFPRFLPLLHRAYLRHLYNHGSSLSSRLVTLKTLHS